MSLIRSNLLLLLLFDLFDVGSDGDDMMLFDGLLLSQLLSVLTAVLSCQRMGILIFLHTHPVDFLVHVALLR